MPTRSPSPRRRAARVLAATATGGLLLVGAALPASAHVHAVPDTTAAGGYSVVTVRVPNESDTASTVRLVLTLPQDTPFSFVAVKPVPGWAAQVTEDPLPTPVTTDGATVTRAPHTVTWTADPGGGIAPGQFQEFDLDLGPLPAAGTRVLLPTVQTYSDGEVSSWTEPSAPGEAEPESPAPEFETTAAVADDDASPVAATTGTTTAGATTTGSTEGPDVLARVLGGAGLALGVLALALAVRGRTRRG
ncbi:YcnI family protein [Kineosporiaceae bacterium B12]|nr:YcnI family protein [Kineococcus rubinsiae]